MTAPAGSEDAGLVLSAEEREALAVWLQDWVAKHHGTDFKDERGALRLVCSGCGEYLGISYGPMDGGGPKAQQKEALAYFRHQADLLAARVEAARAEAIHAATLRVRRLAESHAVTERARGRGDEERDWLDVLAVLDQDAARVARTPSPAGDAQGSQEASNGPVTDGDAGDGRGHGRDDESGRGAGL